MVTHRVDAVEEEQGGGGGRYTTHIAIGGGGKVMYGGRNIHHTRIPGTSGGY